MALQSVANWANRWVIYLYHIKQHLTWTHTDHCWFYTLWNFAHLQCLFLFYLASCLTSADPLTQQDRTLCSMLHSASDALPFRLQKCSELNQPKKLHIVSAVGKISPNINTFWWDEKMFLVSSFWLLSQLYWCIQAYCNFM